jgi:outer membrane protein assembly factor BamB
MSSGAREHGGVVARADAVHNAGGTPAHPLGFPQGARYHRARATIEVHCMYRFFHPAVVLALMLASAHSALAMELVWTKPAGQFRAEATPLVEDLDGDGAVEILSVNLGGQVLLWEVDGTPVGAGQDGMVAQLPEGRWTSAPVLVDGASGLCVVFGSVEGNLIALDGAWAVAWQHALGAETTWSRAVPAVAVANGKTLLCVGDASGKVTALDAAGAVAWSTPLEGGPCRAMVQTYTDASGKTVFLASAGETLFALDTAGVVAWRRALGGEILSRAEVLALPEGDLILCGTKAGSLYALTPAGEVAWEAKMGGEIDTSITFLPREGREPLILCTGVWGNLHAIESDGSHVWSHVFDTKNRARPLVADANGDGAVDVLVATYDQRLLIFDADGLMIDEVRLAGAINASPVLVPGESGQSDVVLFSNTLMAYRLRPGMPVSPYGPTPTAESVVVHRADLSSWSRAVVANPRGALLRVNTTVERASGHREIRGMMTVRSLFELPMPAEPDEYRDIRMQFQSADGHSVRHGTNLGHFAWPSEPEWQSLEAWASTAAYGDFDPAEVEPPAARSGAVEREVAIRALYQGETGHAAFIVASRGHDEARLRVSIRTPALPDGTAFAGALDLHEVVSVGTVNGEQAADALVALKSDTVSIPAGRAAKYWVRVAAGDAASGVYSGTVMLEDLQASGEASRTLPLRIEVSPLRMPDEFPLTLCTWDYIPNQWFPDNPEAVLDSMGAHGVSVFPRTAAPAAVTDAGGALRIDWTALDVELDRLKGRGELLLQIADPPITWAEGFPEARKRALKLDYLRQLRDHLKVQGWDYGDYALYPVDEPGLEYGRRVPVYTDAAELFREADPKLRVYTDPVPGLSWRDFERIDPLVDVWCPNMRLVTGLLVGDPRMQRIMDSGKPVWSYECVSQVKSLSPLVYNRANAWRAWHFGLDGIGFWTFSTTQADHWLANADKNDEYALVYPGEAPVSSVRWEAVRDGLEDVAAMALLKARIEANRSKPEKAALVKEAEEALRIAAADVMELSAPAFIESRDFRAQGNRRLWHTATDEWLFRMHRVKIARLTLGLDG